MVSDLHLNWCLYNCIYPGFSNSSFQIVSDIVFPFSANSIGGTLLDYDDSLSTALFKLIKTLLVQLRTAIYKVSLETMQPTLHK